MAGDGGSDTGEQRAAARLGRWTHVRRVLALALAIGVIAGFLSLEPARPARADSYTLVMWAKSSPTRGQDYVIRGKVKSSHCMTAQHSEWAISGTAGDRQVTELYVDTSLDCFFDQAWIRWDVSVDGFGETREVAIEQFGPRAFVTRCFGDGESILEIACNWMGSNIYQFDVTPKQGTKGARHGAIDVKMELPAGTKYQSVERPDDTDCMWSNDARAGTTGVDGQTVRIAEFENDAGPTCDGTRPQTGFDLYAQLPGEESGDKIAIVTAREVLTGLFLDKQWKPFCVAFGQFECVYDQNATYPDSIPITIRRRPGSSLPPGEPVPEMPGGPESTTTVAPADAPTTTAARAATIAQPISSSPRFTG